MRHHQQKASALLTALFITALAAILATAVIYKFRLLVHLATLNNFSNQSTLYLIGLQDQVAADITAYATSWNRNPNQDSPNLTVPNRIGPQTFQNTQLEARVIDAQGLFNINSLNSIMNQTRFLQLLKYALPKISMRQDLQLMQNISDWLSLSNLSDPIYAHFDPPYRAAHRPLQDVSELRLVAGMTPQIYSALKPYLIALPAADSSTPQTSEININTAPPAVLMTLSSQLTPEKAQSLYECRRGHGVFFNTADYNKVCVKPLGIAAVTNITTHSNYFLVHSSATRRAQQVLMSSLLSTLEDPNTKRYTTYVVWQVSG